MAPVFLRHRPQAINLCPIPLPIARCRAHTMAEATRDLSRSSLHRPLYSIRTHALISSESIWPRLAVLQMHSSLHYIYTASGNHDSSVSVIEESRLRPSPIGRVVEESGGRYRADSFPQVFSPISLYGKDTRARPL